MDAARYQVEPYGFTVAGDGRLVKGSAKYGVSIKVRQNGFDVVAPDGTLMWSGSCLVEFLHRFRYVR